MKELASSLVINFTVALIILIVGWWIARQLRMLVVSIMEKKNVDPLLVSFTSNIAYIALVLFVIIAALGQLGVQTTSFIAIVGAAGLAIALSLQSSLSNFASGIIIIFFRPFKVGDYIEAAGTAGIVEGIQMFFTQLKTPDNKSITVPNSGITSSIITNYSAKKERRVDMVFGISYNDDIKKAKAILKDMLEMDERVLKDPEPVIAVSQLADSSVNLIIRPWVKTDDYWNFYWDMTESVKIRFDEEDITIPFPQREMHVYQYQAA
jgi:small conductance mechanosensitive channel